MAVYCGVCACRLGGASENNGSFPTTAAIFKSGWDCTGGLASTGRIQDTCDDCGTALRRAVGEVAERIAQRNQSANLALYKVIQEQRARETKAQMDRQRFEAEWAARQRRANRDNE